MLINYKSVALFSLMIPILVSKLGYAEDYFAPELIEGINNDDKQIDLSAFKDRDGQLPGKYYTYIFVNNNIVSKKDVIFRYSKVHKELVPVFTKKDYVLLGISDTATHEFSILNPDDTITHIGLLIPDVKLTYSFNEKRLNISVPQLYLNRDALGNVPQNLWDDGITTGFTNYFYTGNSTKDSTRSGFENTSYLNLRSGVNFGAWRYRNYSVFNHSETANQWKSVNNFIERDIRLLKSRVTLGDVYTESDLFDSFAFRGIKIASDEAMLPSSQRGFAPKIRGIAQSSAVVSIKQNGVVIRKENVAAGPFVIDDLYPTSTSGDLDVIIEEANGSKRSYVQAFSSVPGMRREGNIKYSVAMGKYRSTMSHESTPTFLQPTLSYGISDMTTIYSGSILSDNYQSLLGGVGRSFGSYGSLSIDGTIAKTTSLGNSKTGNSFRMQYAKDIDVTNTNLTLASYRYSTENYNDFSEANQNKAMSQFYWLQSKKDKLQININQGLNDFDGNSYGNLYFSAYQQRYWRNNNTTRNFDLGYSNYLNNISYSLAYSYARGQLNTSNEQIFSLSVSIPFGRNKASNVYLSTVSDKNKLTNTLMGINGSVTEDGALGYNIQASHMSNSQNSNAFGTFMNYKTSIGEYQLGYDQSKDNKRISYSTSGSVVAHPYGITFGQSMGETAALVKAPKAKDIKVSSNTGVYTNRFGYAIVPYVSPYERNTLALDTTTIGNNTDIVSNINTVVPTRGALVLVDYQTRIGSKIMVKLNGRKIPFGAKATIEHDDIHTDGIVDDDQNVYLSGVPEEGVIKVVWNNDQCRASYKLQKMIGKIKNVAVTCI